ncbi:hypothetical protein ACWD4X_24880 [Streptomyces termitum]
MVQTRQGRATAATVRGSLLVVLFCLPFLMTDASFPLQALPFLTACLMASHGSVLVYRRFRHR